MVASLGEFLNSLHLSPLTPEETSPQISPSTTPEETSPQPPIPKVTQVAQRQLPPPRRPIPPPSERSRPSQPPNPITPLPPANFKPQPSYPVPSPLAPPESKAPEKPHTPRFYSHEKINVTPQAVKANGWKRNNAGPARVYHFYTDAQRASFLKQSPAIQRQIKEQKDHEYGIDEYLKRLREADAGVKKISKILIKKE